MPLLRCVEHRRRELHGRIRALIRLARQRAIEQILQVVRPRNLWSRRRERAWGDCDARQHLGLFVFTGKSARSGE